MTSWNLKIDAAEQIWFEHSPEDKTAFTGVYHDLVVLVKLTGIVSVLMGGYILV